MSQKFALQKIAGLVLLGTVLAVSFQNCSQSNFETIDEDLKSQVLRGDLVFASGSGETTEGVTPPIQGGSSSSGTTGGGATVPVEFVCSSEETFRKGTNLAESRTVKAVVRQYVLVAQDGEIQLHPTTSDCVESIPRLRETIMEKKEIKLSQCTPRGTLMNASSLSGFNMTSSGLWGFNIANRFSVSSSATVGKEYYQLDLVNENGVSLISSRGQSETALSILYWENPSLSNRPTHVTATFEPQLVHSLEGEPATSPTAPTQGSGEGGSGTVTPSASKCDTRSSPLFVDLRAPSERNQAVRLSAPWAGVKFDIMGDNAEPVKNFLFKISWFKSGHQAFIALPDDKGQVNGIDQLFGDNTRGPDGGFAANGYAALAKYDENGDQLITVADSIFPRLRLWMDRNANAVSERGELIPLKDAGFAVIDLRYDAGYSETDMYNNAIKYKSVAKKANGDYHLVYDVWFETNLEKARATYIEHGRRP